MNVFEMVATLVLDSDKFKDGLAESEKTASGFGDKLGGLLGAAGKFAAVSAGAVTAAGGAVAAFGKEAVDSYASFEQLSGGVSKLFGDASADILEYAQNAYRTSGMSANAYLETATSFSASLIKSLNGDTAEAARITDIAMQAMSDNVNTFGTDMASVQNTFSGLSKQNYTMLDNLKLGYAGTAQGMVDLINDSGVLGRTLTDTSELGEVGFANMILAIQAVQEQQRIAGTTAKEAMTTIEGSATATKAAWENVILAIGNGEGLSEAIDSLIGAIFGEEEGEGLLNQLIPTIQRVMEGIGQFIVEAAPFISGKLPELILAIIPPLFEAAMSLLSSLATELPILVSTIFPTFVENGLSLLNKLSEGFRTGIPSFLSEALPMLLSFTEELRSNFGTIVDSGIETLLSFVDGLVDAMPDLIAYVPNIITNIARLINDNAPKIIRAGFEIIGKLIMGIINNVPNLLANFGSILEAVWNVITAVNWISLGSQVIGWITSGVKNLAASLPGALKNIAQNGWNAVKNIDWKGIGSNIIHGIVAGIKNFGGAIGETLLGFARDAWKSVKSFFGISSPSKLMRDTIGKFIPEGIAVGIDANADSVYDAMNDLSNMTVDAYNPEVEAPAVNGGKGGTYTINVYPSEGMDEETLARRVGQIIAEQQERGEVVYA